MHWVFPYFLDARLCVYDQRFLFRFLMYFEDWNLALGKYWFMKLLQNEWPLAFCISCLESFWTIYFEVPYLVMMYIFGYIFVHTFFHVKISKLFIPNAWFFHTMPNFNRKNIRINEPRSFIKSLIKTRRKTDYQHYPHSRSGWRRRWIRNDLVLQTRRLTCNWFWHGWYIYWCF